MDLFLNENIDRQRILQPQLPNYTSPPLEDALQATPGAFRGDDVIDKKRALDADGNCTVANGRETFNFCQIPFVPDVDNFDKPSPLGVILYGGALVDPRAYAVLARRLADWHGLPVVIPVFEDDLQFTFGECNSGRLELAEAAFPSIEKWLFVGHSYGGTGAMTDVWVESKQGADFGLIAGLVLLAADVRPILCPGTLIDYSGTDLPMAAVTASEDGIINMTEWEENKVYLSTATTFVVIEGGNHAFFGDYDDTRRTPILGQVDGEPNITKYEQWNMTIDAIMDVAQRSGLELPTLLPGKDDFITGAPTTSGAVPCLVGSAALVPWVLFLFSLVWNWRK